MSESSRGLFITMEGGEGVGKTTNLVYLEAILSSHGFDVLVTREPGGTQIGEEIRGLLLRPRNSNISAITELLLMFSARAQHLAEVIEPALAAGKWVLCDRFTDATYAYQCGGRGVPRSHVQTLEKLVLSDLSPDCTILLDAPVSQGMERARGRGELDRIETEAMDFFERVRAEYLRLAHANPERYCTIDAGQPLEQVQAQLLKVAKALVLSRNTTWKGAGDT